MRLPVLPLVLAPILAIVAYGPTAGAGFKDTLAIDPGLAVAVDLLTGSKNASGSMGFARGSIDPYQYIGCDLNADFTGQWVACYARDSTGAQLGCISRIPAHVEAAKSFASSSFVPFGVNEPSPTDPLGVTCHSVVNVSWSSFPAKQ